MAPARKLTAEPRLANKDREFFVSRDVAGKVIEACPDAEWRLLFALSRYGGLRCPSEHLSLRWGDVDWERDRIRVVSPKTEHHEGKGFRWLPIFPELRPHMEAVWEQAAPGTEYVINRYRDRNANLRTQLERIVRKAGLEPWPKPFQNLRSTRETELAEQFPIHVVCEWIGNSATIAAKHYLQVTDEHFKEAAGKVTHNPTQTSAASSRHDKTGPTRNPANRGESEESPVLLNLPSSPKGTVFETIRARAISRTGLPTKTC
jgi:integrase